MPPRPFSVWKLIAAGILIGVLLLTNLVLGDILFFVAFLDEFDTGIHYAPGSESLRHFWGGVGILYVAVLGITAGLIGFIALLAKEEGWSGRAFATSVVLGVLSQVAALQVTLLGERGTTWFDTVVRAEVVVIPAVLVVVTGVTRARAPETVSA